MKRKMKFILISVGIISIFMYLSLNIFSYFDPFSFCRIKIHSDILNGDRSTIKKALRRLKSSNPSDYRYVCRYVTAISEGRCMNGDPRVDASFVNPDSAGCFIRGTKMIYIRPTKNVSIATVEDRAKLIATYARMSRDFWNLR